ncbi:hypothetical protein [Kribbella rubisoli]|uniref:hypothetical protein n=1 Tax=Kribbella rubisoli TaxID=3075929 RepID=UPI00130095A3|nr:hypothetical protein [Kribbella rubisoli]
MGLRREEVAVPAVVGEPLAGDTFGLEGEQLVAIDLGHTGTDGTSALHVPSIGLVIAGDVVYDEVHLYLAESVAGGIDQWLAGLDVLERLHLTRRVPEPSRSTDKGSARRASARRAETPQIR